LDKKGPVTIKDIAIELGISASTVSRALSDSPLVKPETKEAVKELAKKYSYQPNFTALSLKSNKTRTIGIIIPQIVHDFFSLVLRGIEDFAYANGYNVIVCSSHEIYDREVMDTKTMLTGRVDGVLVCISKETMKFDHIHEFQHRGIPLVLFDRAPDGIQAPKIVIDDFKAAFDVTSHLIDQGCSRLAFIGGPKSLAIYEARFNGFTKAMESHHLDVDKDLVIHLDSEEFEHSITETSQVVSNRPDGIFAATDMMAIGAMKNVKKSGLRVPEDIMVAGFSNWTISSLYEPSLTTVNQPGYEMGYRAAEILIDQILNPDRTKDFTEILETELIIRDSSKRP
jgi:LacI family transcriptional regulator